MSFVRPAAAAVALSALFALAGCGKSPEAVCKKLDELDKSKDKQPVAECVSDLETVKKEAPKGYDCIAKCSDMTTEEGLGLCMLGCIAGDKELQKVYEKLEEKNKDKREAREAERLVELTKKADKTFDATLKSFSGGETKYSITLIEGFKDPKGDSIMNTFDFDDSELSAPHFTIMVSDDTPAKALEESVSTAEMLKDTVIKKESNDSGFTLHTESEYSLAVEMGIKSGDKLFECKARMSSGAVKQKKDVFIPWLEKMCKSIKAK